MFIDSELMLMRPAGAPLPSPDAAVKIAVDFGLQHVKLSHANDVAVIGAVEKWCRKLRSLNVLPGLHVHADEGAPFGLARLVDRCNAHSLYLDRVECGDDVGGKLLPILDRTAPYHALEAPIIQASLPAASQIDAVLPAGDTSYGPHAGKPLINLWMRSTCVPFGQGVCTVAPALDWPRVGRSLTGNGPNRSYSIEREFGKYAAAWDAHHVPTVVSWLRPYELARTALASAVKKYGPLPGDPWCTPAEWYSHLGRLCRFHPHRALSIQLWLDGDNLIAADGKFWTPSAIKLVRNHEARRRAAFARMSVSEPRP